MMNSIETHSEAFDDDITDVSLSALLDQSGQHQSLLREYCSLALKPTLTEAEQDRMAEILELGAQDAVLNFWLEEGDHLVAHHLGLIDERFINRQQAQFQDVVSRHTVENLRRDLDQTKVLQTYLHHQGIYHGLIDGVMGPSTQAALQQLTAKRPDALRELKFI
ncbi:MAG TPA: peptidoglycan-binding domain-containing protein [Candidatus Obscuribacterales bacterium]